MVEEIQKKLQTELENFKLAQKGRYYYEKCLGIFSFNGGNWFIVFFICKVKCK